jgi:hypothetical protein
MSDLLNKASLVVIPSGYKEDTVYSVVPSDGSGDLSFTRASNGTRINSAGLVEVCPWNLLQQSETFDNAAWSKLGATVTANDITAPNGTLTADKVVFSGANNSIYQAVSLNGEIATRFVYIKGTAGETISIDDIYVSQPNITLTGDWQLIGFTSATPSLRGFGISTYGGATARTIWLWGAQLNIGSTAKPYFPTTDRLNVPRLTYQNGGGGCPSLLLEKQSSNQFLRSQEFDNATWIKGSNVSVTANSIVSPDGTQNADTVTNSGATIVYIYQLSQGTATTWTTSFYAKKGTNKYLGISITAYSYVNERYQPVFNLDDGTIQAQNTSGSNVTNTSCSITPVGNGWYRITATGTFAAGSDYCYAVLQSSNNTNYQPDTATGSLDWTNATNGNAYLWGAQIEASSYPTSYIPTTSASATRVADACSKTGISSLIGQTEGVLFAEFDMISNANSGAYQTIINIATDANNSIDILKNNTTSELYVFAINGGVIQVNSVGISGTNILGRHKIALAYKSNDYVCYLDGVQVFTDTSASVPACSNLYLGAYLGASNILAGSISQAVLFKTRLTNAELASLTTI